jgi:hypothetical protein
MAHVNISHFVGTAREDGSIMPIVEEFAGSCRPRHQAVQETGEQTANARTNYINPERTPLVLNPSRAEAALLQKLHDFLPLPGELRPAGGSFGILFETA